MARKKRTIFEQLEYQKEQLKQLEEKKKKKIEQTILKAFDFLKEKENFFRLLEELEKPNSDFAEKVKKFICKELKIEEISKENEEKE